MQCVTCSVYYSPGVGRYPVGLGQSWEGSAKAHRNAAHSGQDFLLPHETRLMEGLNACGMCGGGGGGRALDGHRVRACMHVAAVPVLSLSPPPYPSFRHTPLSFFHSWVF